MHVHIILLKLKNLLLLFLNGYQRIRVTRINFNLLCANFKYPLHILIVRRFKLINLRSTRFKDNSRVKPFICCKERVISVFLKNHANLISICSTLINLLLNILHSNVRKVGDNFKFILKFRIN